MQVPKVPITTLIADDEPPARARLRSLLEGDAEVRIVGECDDGASAISLIQQLKPSLVFMDIEMPAADGFEVLRAIDWFPAIVFVTAYPSYAVPAFEACALDYLLKPFLRSRFFSVLERAKNHIRRNAEYDREQDSPGRGSGSRRPAELLIVKSAGRLVFLRVSELKWVQADKDYVRLHLRKGSHFVRETMTSIQNKLDAARFVRIHRSALVNIGEICEVRPLLGGDCNVLLRDGTELTLSRRYRSGLDSLLSQQNVQLPK
jgi:two-component system, LytTR family, response regulator